MVGFNVGASLPAVNRQDAEGAHKTAEDLDRYMRVIADTRPDLIIETGTETGGSALWFTRSGVDVVTIDVDHSKLTAAAAAQRRIVFLAGDSTDPKVVAAVRRIAAQYERVMVVLDSDHRGLHVAAEIIAYAGLVTPGCYLVVEDGICRWLPGFGGGGPLDAIEYYLVDDPRFTEDTEVEAMHPVTMHPRGWWRRA